MQTTSQSAARLMTAGLGLAALTLLGLAAAPAAQAQTYTLKTLATFNGTNGNSAVGGLTLVGSTLYGATSQGGTDFGSGFRGDGTVFSVPISGGAVTSLASLNQSDLVQPESGLTLIGSTLYGTTVSGGTSNDGAVFSIPVGGTTPTLLASFLNSTNGGGPIGNLTLSADGKTLYGTTSGTNDSMGGNGTVFSIPVGGGPLTVLASFNRTNGYEPLSNLTLSADGSTLYGTTYGSAKSVLGSYYGGGTVFSVSTSGGAVNDLYTFSGTDGSNPRGSLTLIGSTLYGTTSAGGANGDGTVFSLTPAAVPEASSLVSFGLLLVGGLGGAALRAKRRSTVG